MKGFRCCALSGFEPLFLSSQASDLVTIPTVFRRKMWANRMPLNTPPPPRSSVVVLRIRTAEACGDREVHIDCEVNRSTLAAVLGVGSDSFHLRNVHTGSGSHTLVYLKGNGRSILRG